MDGFARRYIDALARFFFLPLPGGNLLGIIHLLRVNVVDRTEPRPRQSEVSFGPIDVGHVTAGRLVVIYPRENIEFGDLVVGILVVVYVWVDGPCVVVGFAVAVWVGTRLLLLGWAGAWFCTVAVWCRGVGSIPALWLG